MGVICDICNRDMKVTDGCNKAEIIYKGVSYEPVKVGDYGDFNYGMDEESRCGDCNAKYGHYHHFGCDCEKCPVCGGQLISCDCLDEE